MPRQDPYESSFTPSRPKLTFTARAGRIAVEPEPSPWGPLPLAVSLATRAETRRRYDATLNLSVATVVEGERTVLPDEEAPAFERAFLEGARSDWSYASSLQPAGSVGTIASVWWTRYQSSGGIAPFTAITLGSFDAATGKRLDLREVLGESLLAEVTTKVRDALRQAENGDLFEHGQPALAQWVASSFRPTGTRGTLLVAIPASIHAAYGTIAEILVTGPAIPAFHPQR